MPVFLHTTVGTIGHNIWRVSMNQFVSNKLLLAVSLVFFSQITLADSSEVDTLAIECKQLNKEHNSSKALSVSSAILKIDNKNIHGLICKSRALAELDKPAEAIATLDEAGKVAVAQFDVLSVMTIKGSVYKNIKDYDAALKAYEAALEKAIALNNYRFQRTEYNLIAETHALKNDHNKALENYLEAGKLSANNEERADDYAKIAAAYSILGKTMDAVQSQLKVVVTVENTSDLDLIAESNLLMGQYYTANKDYKLAEIAINKVTKLAVEYGGAYWEAKSYYALALTKRANQELAAANDLLAKAKKINDTVGDKELSAEIQKAQNS